LSALVIIARRKLFSVRTACISQLERQLKHSLKGLGWSYPCDAFSLGCILVEFFTGVALFQTHDNLDHLAMMEMVMGKMPERFARAGARSKPEFFKEGSKLNWPKPKATRQSKKDVRATRPLQVCPHILLYLSSH
jgi:dual-specificity kinase